MDDDEASRGQSGDRAMLLVMMAKLHNQAEALESGRLEKPTVPSL